MDQRTIRIVAIALAVVMLLGLLAGVIGPLIAG
jgi:hypothetical protein